MGTDRDLDMGNARGAICFAWLADSLFTISMQTRIDVLVSSLLFQLGKLYHLICNLNRQAQVLKDDTVSEKQKCNVCFVGCSCFWLPGYGIHWITSACQRSSGTSDLCPHKEVDDFVPCTLEDDWSDIPYEEQEGTRNVEDVRDAEKAVYYMSDPIEKGYCSCTQGIVLLHFFHTPNFCHSGHSKIQSANFGDEAGTAISPGSQRIRMTGRECTTTRTSTLRKVRCPPALSFRSWRWRQTNGYKWQVSAMHLLYYDVRCCIGFIYAARHLYRKESCTHFTPQSWIVLGLC